MTDRMALSGLKKYVLYTVPLNQMSKKKYLLPVEKCNVKSRIFQTFQNIVLRHLSYTEQV